LKPSEQIAGSIASIVTISPNALVALNLLSLVTSASAGDVELSFPSSSSAQIEGSMASIVTMPPNALVALNVLSLAPSEPARYAELLPPSSSSG
jgi:hypothetical protein